MNESQPSPADRRHEFTNLLTAHHAQLAGYVRSMVLDPNDAQDVFQETAITLWRKFEEYDRDLDFGAWAMGVARFKVLDFFKMRGRRQAHFSNAMMEELDRLSRHAQKSASDDRAARLETCIERLSDRQKELLDRCYNAVESVADVATSLGRTPKSIYGSLRHIRHKLLECIQLPARRSENGK